MLHFHKTNEFICSWGGEVSTYNFMFYVNVRRLNNIIFNDKIAPDILYRAHYV